MYLVLQATLLIRVFTSTSGHVDENTEIRPGRPPRSLTPPGACIAHPFKESGQQGLSCRMAKPGCNQVNGFLPVLSENFMRGTPDASIERFICTCKCCISQSQCGPVAYQEFDISRGLPTVSVRRDPGTCSAIPLNISSCKKSKNDCNQVQWYLPVMGESVVSNTTDPNIEKLICTCKCCISKSQCGAVTYKELDLSPAVPTLSVFTGPGTCSATPLNNSSCKNSKNDCNHAQRYLPVIEETAMSDPANPSIEKFTCTCKCCINKSQCGAGTDQELDIPGTVPAVSALTGPGTCNVTLLGTLTCSMSHDGCNIAKQYRPLISEGRTGVISASSEILYCTCKCCKNGSRCGDITRKELDLGVQGICNGVIYTRDRACLVPKDTCRTDLGYKAYTDFSLVLIIGWRYKRTLVCLCKCCKGRRDEMNSETCGVVTSLTRIGEIWPVGGTTPQDSCSAFPAKSVKECVIVEDGCTVGYRPQTVGHRYNKTIGYVRHCMCHCCPDTSKPRQGETDTRDWHCKGGNWGCLKTTTFLSAQNQRGAGVRLPEMGPGYPCPPPVMYGHLRPLK